VNRCEKINLKKLTKEDWKKSFQELARSKNYQEEVKLWDSIDDD
jgi:hypothetical protein